MNENYSSCINRIDLFSKYGEYTSPPKYWRTWHTKMLGFMMVLLVFLLGSINAVAQSTANYAFTTGTNGSLTLDSGGNAIDMTTGTIELYGPGVDSYTNAGVKNFGFTFYFMGTAYTQWNANPDGQIRLGTTLITGHTSSASNGAAFLVACNIDAETNVTTGKVHYKVQASSEGQVLIVEWKDLMLNWSATGTTPSTFQTRIYESGVVEYVYGQMFNSATSAQSTAIGFSSSNSAGTIGQIITINTTPNYTTTGTSYTSTSFAASAAMTNLNSSSEGDRRFFSFTPPAVVNGDVANLTYAAVASSTTTLNWVDNATNETRFLVTRATDASFTQNVISTNVPTTTSAGIGTAYTLIQSGLTPGTTYYYKVQAVVEGGGSTGITGSQATAAAATYYWVGPASSTWNTAANWNTNPAGGGSARTTSATTDVLIVDGAGTVAGGAVTISIDAAYSIGQLKVTNGTTLNLQATTTTTRTITITGAPGDDLVVEAGSILNLVHATQATAIAFSGNTNSGIIAGTYNAAGSTSNTINTTGGVGTLVTISSTGSVNSALNSSSGALTGNATSLLFQNDSNYTHSNSTTVNYIPTATWQPTATATLNGNTTGSSLTSSSTSLGNLVINTTSSTVTLSAFTSNSRTIQGNLTINSTGTGKFRALTSGFLTINGDLIINGGTFEVGSSSSGVLLVKGNVTLGSGATLDFNQSTLELEGDLINDGSILSSETSTSNSKLNMFGDVLPQAISGSGTFTGRISSLGVYNYDGITVSTPLLTQRVNLFGGMINGSENITIGTGLALAAAVQVGSVGLTSPGGNFDVTPTFNLGTGLFTILYLDESTPRSTGFEVPSSRTISNLTINNANGVTINGGDLTVVNALALTKGIVSTGVHTLQLGTDSSVGSLTGGSDTAYVDGILIRSIASANTNSTYVSFPIGKDAVYTPIAIAPATTSIALFKAASFASNAGTTSPSITALSATRRFEALPVSGSFTDINVRLSDAGIVAGNIPVQAPSAAGVYTDTFGSTAAFVAGPPITLTSTTSATNTNYTGYLSYANAGGCSGVPAPGNTIASSSTICFGESVSLSLQSSTPGSGITYQWKSSADGVTYSAIGGATASTLTVTPTAATYYLCEVTCTGSSSTTASTAVHITFSYSVVSTTPASRCGVGVVTLGATPSAGATINWYADATGGASLATGNSFETPSISSTTSYYVSAGATSSPALYTVGSETTLTSATTQPTAFCNRWSGYTSQTIYTVAELNALGMTAGSITSLGFNITTLGDAATNANFTVKIGSTLLALAPSNFVTGLATVYGPVTYTHSATGMQTIPFSTPFVWDGASNIIVEVKHNGANLTNNAITYYSTTAGAMTVTATSTSAISGTTSNQRLNTTFGFINTCESARTMVSATISSPPALTVSDAALTICSGADSSTVTVTSNVADYDDYTWSPAMGVTGDEVSGWIFNPTATTTYTLTANQTSGSLCSATATVNVTVNPLPSAITFSPLSPALCVNEILPLTVVGGTSSNIQILSEDFNGATNNWTTVNNSSGGAPNNAAWTLRNSPYSAEESVSSNDASQFYFTDSDAQGSGGTTNTYLESPSFSTISFNSANLEFFHYFRNISSSFGKVQYSIDNVTWVDIVTYTGSKTGTAGAFAQALQSLPAGALNQADVRIRFYYSGTWAYYWAIDNVSIKGTKTTNITWSPSTNLYTDAAATVAYVNGADAGTVYVKSASIGTTNYTVTATSGAGCTSSNSVGVTVSAMPTVITVAPAPIAPAATADLTAAAITAGSTAGLTFTYFTDAAATIAVGNPAAVGVGTYYIKGTSASGCSAMASVKISSDVTTYELSGWDYGVPTEFVNAVINSDFSTTGDLRAKSLTINSGKVITVKTGTTLTVEQAITNNAGITGFIVESDGVVLQTSTAQNTALATVLRNSTPLYRQDYTLWSSPVSGMNLRSFSPGTVYSRFYSYDTTLGTNGNYVSEITNTETMNSTLFTLGKGYLIRMPNDANQFGTDPAQVYNGAFKGTLNNGLITMPLSVANTALNLVGNPYPSPIDINLFFASNSGIDQTLYFWRKKGSVGDPTNAISGYATRTGMGVASADPALNGSSLASIQTGQGFFVKSAGATNLVFNNGMRTSAGSTFFKSADTTNELHRYWLNLSSTTTILGQALIGYATGATQGVDNGIDALYFNDAPTALTSLIDNAEYIIQGRSLPFVNSDIVPLGFKTSAAGSFTISLANFDGLFAQSQDIYLRDNATNTLHNLKLADYTFTAQVGVFNTRFEVHYNTTLGTDNPIATANQILIGVKNQQIKINAGSIVMEKIELIDVAGRVIYTVEGVNATTATIENIVASNQMLIVRISTKESGVVNQKIIF